VLVTKHANFPFFYHSLFVCVACCCPEVAMAALIPGLPQTHNTYHSNRWGNTSGGGNPYPSSRHSIDYENDICWIGIKKEFDQEATEDAVKQRDHDRVRELRRDDAAERRADAAAAATIEAAAQKQKQKSQLIQNSHELKLIAAAASAKLVQNAHDLAVIKATSAPAPALAPPSPAPTPAPIDRGSNELTRSLCAFPELTRSLCAFPEQATTTEKSAWYWAVSFLLPPSLTVSSSTPPPEKLDSRDRYLETSKEQSNSSLPQATSTTCSATSHGKCVEKESWPRDDVAQETQKMPKQHHFLGTVHQDANRNLRDEFGEEEEKDKYV